MFDAAWAELGVVARGQPCSIIGDFNVEPTKIPCLFKGITAGLCVDLEAAWAGACGSQPAAPCKRSCDSSGGNRKDCMVGCPLTSAAVRSCMVNLGWWLQLQLAVRAYFDCHKRGLVELLSPFSALLCGLLPGCLLLTRVEVLDLLRYRGFGRFMMTAPVPGYVRWFTAG